MCFIKFRTFSAIVSSNNPFGPLVSLLSFSYSHKASVGSFPDFPQILYSLFTFLKSFSLCSSGLIISFALSPCSDSFFHLFKSAFNSIWWIFHFCLNTFQLENFLGFSISVDITIQFIQYFLYFLHIFFYLSIFKMFALSLCLVSLLAVLSAGWLLLVFPLNGPYGPVSLYHVCVRARVCVSLVVENWMLESNNVANLKIRSSLFPRFTGFLFLLS